MEQLSSAVSLWVLILPTWFYFILFFCLENLFSLGLDCSRFVDERGITLLLPALHFPAVPSTSMHPSAQLHVYLHHLSVEPSFPLLTSIALECWLIMEFIYSFLQYGVNDGPFPLAQTHSGWSCHSAFPDSPLLPDPSSQWLPKELPTALASLEDGD